MDLNRWQWNSSGLNLSIFNFNLMFKQHINLLIWTWILVHLTKWVKTAIRTVIYARIPILTANQFDVHCFKFTGHLILSMAQFSHIRHLLRILVVLRNIPILYLSWAGTPQNPQYMTLTCIKLITYNMGPWPFIQATTLYWCSSVIPLFRKGHKSPESPWIDFFLIRGDSWGFINFFSPSVMSYESFPIQIQCRIRGNRLNSAGIAQEFITIRK